MTWPITIWKMDGLEHGVVATTLYDVVSAGAPAIVTTPVRSGLRSLEISASAAAERVAYNLPGSTSIVMQACAIRFAALPTADIQLLSYTNANGNGRLIFDNATDRFAVNINNVDNQVFGPNPIATGTWYLLVTEFDTTGGTNQVHRGKCFDATTGAQIGTTATSTRAQTAAASTVVSLGTLSAETGTFYIDDWFASVTDGDFELMTSQMCPWAIESLIVNGDGTHSITANGDFDSFTTTQFQTSTTTANTFIAHRPLQMANTAEQVIRQELGTTANYMEFTLGDLTLAGSPKAVRCYGSHVESATTGASLAEMRLLLADNTEVLTEGSLSMIDTSEDPGTTVTLRKRMAIDPTGGWDRDRINNMKMRLGFGDNAPDVNFIDSMFEVLLTPASLVYKQPRATVAAMLRR